MEEIRRCLFYALSFKLFSLLFFTENALNYKRPTFILPNKPKCAKVQEAVCCHPISCTRPAMRWIYHILGPPSSFLGLRKGWDTVKWSALFAWTPASLRDALFWGPNPFPPVKLKGFGTVDGDEVFLWIYFCFAFSSSSYGFEGYATRVGISIFRAEEWSMVRHPEFKTPSIAPRSIHKGTYSWSFAILRKEKKICICEDLENEGIFHPSNHFFFQTLFGCLKFSVKNESY